MSPASEQSQYRRDSHRRQNGKMVANCSHRTTSQGGASRATQHPVRVAKDSPRHQQTVRRQSHRTGHRDQCQLTPDPAHQGHDGGTGMPVPTPFRARAYVQRHEHAGEPTEFVRTAATGWSFRSLPRGQDRRPMGLALPSDTVPFDSRSSTRYGARQAAWPSQTQATRSGKILSTNAGTSRIGPSSYTRCCSPCDATAKAVLGTMWTAKTVRSAKRTSVTGAPSIRVPLRPWEHSSQ